MASISSTQNPCGICSKGFYQNESVIKKENYLTLEELDQIVNTDLVPTQLKCNHAFHNSCLIEWIKKLKEKMMTSCPTCSAALEAHDTSANPSSFEKNPRLLFRSRFRSNDVSETAPTEKSNISDRIKDRFEEAQEYLRAFHSQYLEAQKALEQIDLNLATKNWNHNELCNFEEVEKLVLETQNMLRQKSQSLLLKMHNIGSFIKLSSGAHYTPEIKEILKSLEITRN